MDGILKSQHKIRLLIHDEPSNTIHMVHCSDKTLRKKDKREKKKEKRIKTKIPNLKYW